MAQYVRLLEIPFEPYVKKAEQPDKHLKMVKKPYALGS